MTFSSPSGGSGSFNRSSFTGLIKNFRTKEFSEKSHISSLNMTEFLRSVTAVGTAFSQQVVDVLKMKIESRKTQNFGAIFAPTNQSSFSDARTEQVRRVLKASMARQTYASSAAYVAQWFFALFREKAYSPLFLTGARSYREVQPRRWHPRRPVFRIPFRQPRKRCLSFTV